MKWILVPLLALAVLGAAGNRRLRYTPPGLELLESVPVETTVGNPYFRPALAVWLEEIASADSTLDFEEFYCSDLAGEPLRAVIDAIGMAAARGVKVRFVLDAGFHKTYPMPADSLGKLPNIEVRWIPFGKLGGGVQHAKFFMADRAVTILGSQNMDWRSLKHIHEMGVCVRDRTVTRFYEDVFELDWKLAAADSAGARALVAAAATRYAPPYTVKGPNDEPVEVWPSATPRGWLPDAATWDQDAVLRRLDGAKSEIAIQVYEYSTKSRNRVNDAFDKALRRAAARGVKVRLALSNWHLGHPDIDFARGIASLPGAEVKIVSYPEWSGGYISFARVDHCKYMVVDSLWTWVGTDNWSPSYFETTRNVALSMKHAGLALEARRSFESVWGSKYAESVKMEGEYTTVIHGETPPAGKSKYGN